MIHGSKIREVRRYATEPLGKDEAGVLVILNSPRFNVATRDAACAEYRTESGEYGQICRPLRGTGFYVRGPHADDVTYQSVEAAVSAVMEAVR